MIAGEWMPVRAFRFEGGRFEEITDALGLGETSGWWNALAAVDLDGDGDLDLVGGNRGLNAQIHAAPGQPASILAADFDGNGSVDPVLSCYIDGVSYPVVSRDEMLGQVNRLKRRFTDYASYADATVEDLFTEEERAGALELTATTFASTVFENVGGRFVARPLPVEAQVAPVHAILVGDLDRDGTTDLLLAGNEFGMRAQDGPMDAGRGLFLRGTGRASVRARRPGRERVLRAGRRAGAPAHHHAARIGRPRRRERRGHGCVRDLVARCSIVSPSSVLPSSSRGAPPRPGCRPIRPRAVPSSRRRCRR